MGFSPDQKVELAWYRPCQSGKVYTPNDSARILFFNNVIQKSQNENHVLILIEHGVQFREREQEIDAIINASETT